MKSRLLSLVLITLSTVVFANPPHPTPQELWQVSGFKMPESVVFDEKRNRYYVSNLNEDPFGQDFNGSVGWIDSEGQYSEIEWITGLSSPKGLALDGDYLYAADVRELVVMNVETGLITARYEVPNGGVLNGVTVTKSGKVFVSDWSHNAIYLLKDNELKVWLADDALESPNGIYVKNGYLYVGAWGTGVQADFSTETTGSLKRISLKTKAIETLSDGSQWMNLDGLHPSKRRQWLSTDFIKGELLKLNRHGEIVESWKLEPSAADFYFNPQQNLLVVPYLMGQKVIAYQFEP